MDKLDKLENLQTLAAIVEAVMEEDERTRSSDSFLYLKVLEVFAKRNECPYGPKTMTVEWLLLHMQEYGLPPFESVRRNRQLVRARRPDLAPVEMIDAYRQANEAVMLEYVRSEKYGS